MTTEDAVSRLPAAVISSDHTTRPVPGLFTTDQALWARVVRYARCADSGLDPDEWFPVSAEAGTARRQAAAAIAVCSACQVRGQCLSLSLRHWDIGQHGVWGGLVTADRARLRARLSVDRTAGRGIADVRDDGAAVISKAHGGG
ncbi:MAG TPA: WhiB family transcriptional regulator [Trebonia sp.]